MDAYLKKFYLTSEFWAMVFGTLINFLNITNIWNFMSNWHSGILMTIVLAAYKVARGYTKNGLLRNPNVNPAGFVNRV